MEERQTRWYKQEPAGTGKVKERKKWREVRAENECETDHSLCAEAPDG